MLKLQSLKVINSDSRITSIDFFRSIAILLVMAVHFNDVISFGYIGVDLFFVISGFLIGGILIRQLKNNQPISFLKFFFQRGFKIWPSFYFFVIMIFIIENKDFSTISKYLFFYQNYTGESSHLWSLCVEEHFYIILPLLFLIIQRLRIISTEKLLIIGIIMLIFTGIVCKFLSYYLTNSQNTITSTHNRIDGLAWGVLLSYLMHYTSIVRKSFFIFIVGLILITLTVYFSFQNVFFQRVISNSIVPFCFFLMIFGFYYIDFSRFKLLRFIAYYSYNLYLWQNLIAGYALDNLGNNWYSFIVYLIGSLLVAIIITILIEEPFLKLRKFALDKVFRK